jgi:hypothetical protein
VHKKKALKEYAVEYKKNMFQLHEHYKTVLKTAGKRVNVTAVIEFMNQQSLSSQLFVLKKFEDSINIIKSVSSPPPKEELNELECPGAPFKESK